MLGAVALLGVICGCEYDEADPGEAPASRGVAGRWSVTSDDWRRIMDIEEANGSLSGRVTAPRGDVESLRGSINGSSVSLMSGDVTGKGTLRGNTMSGTYARPNGNSSTWRARRQ